LGSRPKQGLTRLWAKRKLENEGKCEGMNSKRSFHFGSLESWCTLEFQKAIAKDKTQWIEKFFISLKNY